MSNTECCSCSSAEQTMKLAPYCSFLNQQQLYMDLQWQLTFPISQIINQMITHNDSYISRQEQSDNHSPGQHLLPSGFLPKLSTEHKSRVIKSNSKYQSIATQITPRKSKPRRVATENCEREHQQNTGIKEIETKKPSIDVSFYRTKTMRNVKIQYTVKRKKNRSLFPARSSLKLEEANLTYGERVENLFDKQAFELLQNSQIRELNHRLEEEILHYNQILQKIVEKHMKFVPGLSNDEKHLGFLEQCLKNNKKIEDRVDYELNSLKERESCLRKYSEEQMDLEIEKAQGSLKNGAIQIKKAKEGIKMYSKTLVEKEQNDGKRNVGELRQKIHKIRQLEKRLTKRMCNLKNRQQELISKIKDFDTKLHNSESQNFSTDEKKMFKRNEEFINKISYLNFENNKIKGLLEIKAHTKEKENASLRINLKNTSAQIANLTESILHLHHKSEDRYIKSRLHNQKIEQAIQNMKSLSGIQRSSLVKQQKTFKTRRSTKSQISNYSNQRNEKPSPKVERAKRYRGSVEKIIERPDLEDSYPTNKMPSVPLKEDRAKERNSQDYGFENQFLF